MSYKMRIMYDASRPIASLIALMLLRNLVSYGLSAITKMTESKLRAMKIYSYSH